MPLQTLEVTTGTTPGRHHRKAATSNQDKVRMVRAPSLIVAGVADGCGSQPRSEVGADLTTKLLLRFILRGYRQGDLDEAWFDTLYQRLVRGLRWAAKTYPDPLAAINERMLATAGGVIIDPRTTYFYGAGDFFFGYNDKVVTWKPEAGNSPLYPVLSLAFPGDERFRFRVQRVPTPQIERLFFGTDGVEQLRQVCEDRFTCIPGTEDTLVGPFSQIWDTDRFYHGSSTRRVPTTGPEATAAWLDTLARDEEFDGFPHAGLLDDDTTFFAARRKRHVRA